MHDVVVYLSSIHKQTPGRKIDTLRAFAEGAKKCGANVHIESQHVFRPAKLAVILGWPSPIQTTHNIKLRAEIVAKQRQTGNHVMSVDANCFKFQDQDNLYLRYSINDVQYDKGEYANKNSTSQRWDQLSNDLKISMNEWKTGGEYILFLIQRDGGWGMKGLSPIEWARDKIKQVKKYTNLHIVLRPHPGRISDLKPLLGHNISISDSINKPLMEDLKQARSSLVFNSSSGVASILSGVPLWVDDSSSVCWDVANKSITSINVPMLFDRTQWAYDLAACHWTDDESRQGLVYKKFLPYLT